LIARTAQGLDMDHIAEIKRLYFEATPATVKKHLAKAIELLKQLPTEEERERAAVFMDGLSQMRGEWATAGNGAERPASKSGARPAGARATKPPAPKRG
jgi:hypothetical protein